MEFAEGIKIQAIINPTAFRTIHHQSCVFQHAQMEREPGLTGLKHLGEVADALFPFFQPFDDPNPRLIREGMEDPNRLVSIS